MAEKIPFVVGILLVLSLCWFTQIAYGQVTDAKEVFALLAIRDKLKDPLKKLNWTRKYDPCAWNWTGVVCSGAGVDGYRHVQELRLFGLNLTGKLAPELGQLPYMKILNFMWNKISGSIPKEIGNITALELLLLSGNQLTGPLPDELGSLPNLATFQLDKNMVSGPIPKTFANLTRVQHLHMNDNQFSDRLPSELSNLTLLKHVLLDNNQLSGYLPPELSQMRGLTILQLDNNNFAGTVIPDTYANMSKLLKLLLIKINQSRLTRQLLPMDCSFPSRLSLRNCKLQGTIPDFSQIRGLLYLDLSMNRLTGRITSNRLSENITTVILSNNSLNGSIPSNFSGLPHLQILDLNTNYLSGFVPSDIWENITFSSEAKLDINLEDNLLSNISGTLDIPQNVTLKIKGNPVCTNANQRNISLLCGVRAYNEETISSPNKQVSTCAPESCRSWNFRYVPAFPDACFCAAPFGIGMELRSPGISKFLPYQDPFHKWITQYVKPKLNRPLESYQLYVDSIKWEPGPRLRIFLLFFPQYNYSVFDESEVIEIANAFSQFTIPALDIFGPYDPLSFTAEGPYLNFLFPPIRKDGGLSKGAVAGIVLGSILCAAVILAGLLFFLRNRNQQSHPKDVKDQSLLPTFAMKMDGVKAFSFEDLEMATKGFRAQIGQGGYGKVYKGTLGDGIVVAIKRAQQGSLQGEKEFYTEIEMLSRVHHRNLVSLVGYCDEKDEQMLVYEFMPNGSLHDLLSAKYRASLNLQTRLHIALGAARGVLYLHTEADPPIIHRDIKANNILLDAKWTAKVSDFGISKLAPVSDVEGVTMAHVSTNVKGTPGYVDPDYFLTHKLTEKSDVYSLGVVFLELLTGMQPIAHGRHIVREVNTAFQSGIMFSIIDRTMGPYNSDSVKKFMALAIRCSMDETKYRPSMLEVVRELENISSMVPESGITPPDFNINMSSSGNSVASPPSSSLYGERKTYASTDLMAGSDLVSGVMATIKPQ